MLHTQEADGGHGIPHLARVGPPTGTLLYRESERFELTVQDRFDTGVYTRVPGNPEGY